VSCALVVHAAHCTLPGGLGVFAGAVGAGACAAILAALMMLWMFHLGAAMDAAAIAESSIATRAGKTYEQPPMPTPIRRYQDNEAAADGAVLRPPQRRSPSPWPRQR
jgi:hypothetical protein